MLFSVIEIYNTELHMMLYI